MHWGRGLVMVVYATRMAVECKSYFVMLGYCLRMVTSGSAGKVKSLDKLVELLAK